MNRARLSPAERDLRSRLAQLARDNWLLRIPRSWEARVRQAVNDYRQLQRLIEEISELEWKRMREKKVPVRWTDSA